MKRKKISTGFGAWQYLGSDLLKVCELNAGEPIKSSCLFAIMVIAISPAALAVSIGNPKARELSRRFAEVISTHPDLTLRLLSVARRKWNPESVTDKARKYVLTHLWYDRKQGDTGKMNNASIKEIQFAADPSLRPGAAQTIKKVLNKNNPKRLNRPSQQLYITEKLFFAVKELRRLGMDVGWGM